MGQFEVPPVDKPCAFSYVKFSGESENQHENGKCFLQCFIDFGMKYKTQFLNLLPTRLKWFVTGNTGSA